MNMAVALLLGLATIATLATFSNGITLMLCPPCTKRLDTVCAEDEEGEVRSFSNPCMIDYCNCLLKNADSKRVFNLVYRGECKVNDTKVPECFLEESWTLSPGAGNRTTTEATSAGSSGATSAPTPGGRISINTTTEAHGVAPGLTSMFLTLVLPLAALSIFL